MDLIEVAFVVIVFVGICAPTAGTAMIVLNEFRATGIMLCVYGVATLVLLKIVFEAALYNASIICVAGATFGGVISVIVKFSIWLENRIGEDELDDDTFEESEEETDLANKRPSDVTI